mgnify:CR=1 FL=1
MLKFKVGDIVYAGGGNGEFCSFFKAKVARIIDGGNPYYELYPIEDYGSIWGNGFPRSGRIENSIESTTFATFEEAKKATFKDMHIRFDKKFIKLYFERKS